MQRIPVSEKLHGTELRLHGLMLRGLDGDAQAYRSFLQSTSAPLRAFLRRRLQRWPDEVEDLVQECLLAIHNQRLTYDTGVPLTSWIHAIARYKLIDWLRRHARRDALHTPYDEDDDAQALFSSADAEANEASRDLARLLATLPAQQRDAIVHTKLDGAMRISEASVKVAVHRGLKALAANLRSTTT